MDNLILKAIYYISKNKVTVVDILPYLNDKRAYNIENKSIIQTLNQLYGKCLIKQLLRPLGKAITLKALHSTPSQSVISPIAENHINGTSENDIINEPIPSINRSLSATPTAGINITLLFVSSL